MKVQLPIRKTKIDKNKKSCEYRCLLEDLDNEEVESLKLWARAAYMHAQLKRFTRAELLEIVGHCTAVIEERTQDVI